MKKIEPRKWYSLHEVFAKEYIPYFKTYMTLRRYADQGLLKVNIYQAGKYKRYFVKGESVIEFLAKWEAGDFRG